MPARRAALLTPTGNGNRPLWSYRHTGTLPQLISFVSHSYENTRGVGVFFPFWAAHFLTALDPSRLPHPSAPVSTCGAKFFRIGARSAQSWCGVSPLAATLMGHPRKCCKQKTYNKLKPFRCNTCKKHGGRPLSQAKVFSPSSLRSRHLCVMLSIPLPPTFQRSNLQKRANGFWPIPRPLCFHVPAEV
jgi:hypothetical protein